MTAQALTVHALRRRWKPIKERLNAAVPSHPTAIRIHRALSWLQRIEQIEEGTDLSEEGMHELMDDMGKGKRTGPGDSAADELFR